MSSKRRFFSGQTLSQAILAAASHHKVDPKEIAYSQREKKHGVARSRKAFVIDVDPARPLKSDQPAPEPQVEVAPSAPEPVVESAPEPEVVAEPVPEPVADPIEEGMITLPGLFGDEPTPPPPLPVAAPEPSAEAEEEEGGEDDSHEEEEQPRRRRRRRRRRSSKPAGEEHPPASKEQIFAAAKENAELLVKLAGLDLEVNLDYADDRLEIDLAGRDIEDALAEDGELLEAVEYLAPRMMRASLGYLVNCRVDCDGFRRERDEELVRLAHRTAEMVRESGRPKTLEPMNPADRRLVHVSLADERGVVTQSVGEGFFKRVSIRPE